MVSLDAAGAVMTVLTVLLLGVVIAVLLGSLEIRPGGRSPWLLVGILLPVAIVLEPVRRTLFYGQINVVLMALVVLDCLVKAPRWPRGALIGLAAAVKLTPAAFLLFFLLRRDRRAALRAVLSFGITTAVGFLVAWGDSVRFWTETLYDAGRVGTLHFAANQSVLGVLARFGIEAPVRVAVWLPLRAAGGDRRGGRHAPGVRGRSARARAGDQRRRGAVRVPGLLVAPLGVGGAGGAEPAGGRLARPRQAGCGAGARRVRPVRGRPALVVAELRVRMEPGATAGGQLLRVLRGAVPDGCNLGPAGGV